MPDASPAIVVLASGQLVTIVSCPTCGAAVISGEAYRRHDAWHDDCTAAEVKRLRGMLARAHDHIAELGGGGSDVGDVPSCPKCGQRMSYTSSHGYICGCPIPIPPTARSDVRSEALGYGRYKDSPAHVGCPRAQSDMTPCIARDGRLAVDDDGECVGCGIEAWDALSALKRAQKLSPPSASQRPEHFADQLQKIVRRVTEPDASDITAPSSD